MLKDKTIGSSIRIPFRTMRVLAGVVIIYGLCLSNTVAAEPSSENETYPAKSVEQIKQQTVDWLGLQQEKPEQWEAELETIWQAATAENVLELVVVTGELSDERITNWKLIGRQSVFQNMEAYEELLEALKKSNEQKETSNRFVLHNVGLLVGTTLTRDSEYDEAWQVFELVDPKLVVEAGPYFFFKAVCAQQLLKREEANQSLSALLEQTEKVPGRYKRVGELMRLQLADLKEESVQEIAHKMGDSERRLKLGRAGRRVQKVQKEILDALDKKIEELEKQQQQQQASAAQGGSNQPSEGSQPLEESRIKGSTAPGKVDPKKYKKQGSWGDLPPKAEARARSMINRDYPAHYQQAIERYFKKLATRPAQD